MERLEVVKEEVSEVFVRVGFGLAVYNSSTVHYLSSFDNKSLNNKSQKKGITRVLRIAFTPISRFQEFKFSQIYYKERKFTNFKGERLKPRELGTVPCLKLLLVSLCNLNL